MALKKSTTAIYGNKVLDAYHRIENLRLSQKNLISFHLKSYVDTNYPSFGESIYHCAYDISGENPIKQAYLHLKSLPEFTDAVDC